MQNKIQIRQVCSRRRLNQYISTHSKDTTLRTSREGDEGGIGEGIMGMTTSPLLAWFKDVENAEGQANCVSIPAPGRISNKKTLSHLVG